MEVTEFLDEQTNSIKLIYKNLTHSYWDATTTGNKESYKKYEFYQKQMAKLFNNKENFAKVKNFLNQNNNPIVKRQLKVLYNSYLGSQGDLKLINKILEKSTAIEQEFNLFRAEVNGKKYTDNEILEILKNETNSEKLKEAWEASKKQGHLVEKDLIELIKLRNQLAKSLGFENYYTLALETGEQTEKEILDIFENLEKETSSIFKKVKQEIDNYLSKRYKTKELKPWHYQDLFFQEAPHIFTQDLDKFYEKDIVGKSEKFYKNIGLDISDIVKRSDLYEKPGKYQHAYCMDMDKEGDIRSVMNIINNEKWMNTVLHEFGHGIYWKYIDKTLPYLIRDAAHTLTTEAIALLFGRNSKNTEFIKRYCNIDAEKIDRIKEDIEKSLMHEELIFAKWAAVMFNFERNLYKNPDQDLNRLWWSLVKKYQLIDFTRDKADWASKIHLVSAPVYYHNYLIGKLFASQMNNYLAKNILKSSSLKNLDYNGKEIGEYFKSRVFFSGALYPWEELIEYSTGEKLNPKYWVKEFC